MTATRHKRGGHFIDVFDPPTALSAGGLLWLHDEVGTTLIPAGFATVCPQTGPTWWSSRITPVFDSTVSVEAWLLKEVVPLFQERWGIERIATAGIGMGGQGALRLAFKQPERMPIVAALDAALDHYERYDEGTPLDEMYSSREACRQDTALLHIHPVRQPKHIWFACDVASRWFRGNDRLHEKLTALGVEHRFIPYRADERSDVENQMKETLAEACKRDQRSLLS